MLKIIMTVGMALSLSVGVWADYVADRKAALALAQAGKSAEALAAFTNMAAGAGSDFQKSDALEQAALCANGLKQYDRALNLAKAIPLPAVSKICRMNLMRENRKYSELIAEFKAEDITSWPENARGDGFYSRGIAYYQLKDGKSAEADLKKAIDYISYESILRTAWVTLGHNYRDNLKDDQKALEAYAGAVKTMQDGSGSSYWRAAVMSSAGILRKQGKYDEALQVLGQVDMKKATWDWGVDLFCACGETLASQGKKAEAISKFNAALGVKGISDAQKENCQKRIKELQADAK